jgi:hypothetical protein
MNRPSKKEIKAAVDKLKDKSSGSSSAPEKNVGKLTEKKSSQRIRKQGV